MFYSCYWNTPPTTSCYRIKEYEVKSWQCYIKPLTTPRDFILEREYRKEAATKLTVLIMRSVFGLHDKLHCVEVLLHIVFVSQAGTHQIIHQSSRYSWKFDDRSQAKSGVKTYYLKIRGAFQRNPVGPSTEGFFSPEIKKYTHRKDSKT